MEDLLQVGAIASTHGVRGEVKVFPTTDEPARFKKLKKVILDTGNEKLELEISQVKFFKNMVILKFRDFDTINDVEKYKGKSLFVTRDQAVKCEKDEYFIADLVGMEVVTEDGTCVGELKDVLQTGANDVYVVKVQEDSPYASKVADKKKELLLPAIKDCILGIDMEERKMLVYLMPGLLEEG
ncbi:16S rRNA processing protein RimM [Lachnospiraceae bacterium 3-1]|nr:16S rRNA processing protein RimM [Lachnospiraceae bacterium 3-1]